jgi:AraC-like DNA-binding protein
MAQLESLEEFYKRKFNWLPENLQQDVGHFNVFRIEDCMKDGKSTVLYSRRDFYKISLIRGENIYHYADKSVTINGTTLMFFNPQVPYTFESISSVKTGFFCIFREAFFTERMRARITELPMFVPGGKPSYILSKKQDKDISDIFTKMLTEIKSDYHYKYDLIMNYVTEIIHHALKMEPSEILYKHPDANARITSVFTELLERQFPIETPSQRFALRSAKDFADQLSVHVNHLNRAIKETTGKTTTEHIAQRLVSEAKALLKHTNWNISEISYSLGFEEPAHFNNFFRKKTNAAPSAFRVV